MIRALIAALAVVAALAAGPAHAVRPDEMLADPALEARAREVGRDLRCLVCRNQSIDDSDADLAHDLRVLVRERLKAGDSDDRVIAYVRARYGDFVLLRPPLEIGALKPGEGEAGAGPAALVAVTVAILVLPIAAWTIYWQLGSPALPDQPFAERQAPASAVAAAPHGDIGAALGRLAAHLDEHPEALHGWLLAA